MKIFNNFNTGFENKILSKTQNEYGKDNVFIVKRSIYYFILNSLIPFFIISVFLGIIVFLIIKYKYSVYFLYLIGFVFLIIMWKFLYRPFIRYKMDFALISPNGVFTYKQLGILNSSYKEINSHKIKTIQIINKTLLGNIFGYGCIDIISDGSDIDIEHKDAYGIIRLSYIKNHYKVKEKISKICYK